MCSTVDRELFIDKNFRQLNFGLILFDDHSKNSIGQNFIYCTKINMQLTLTLIKVNISYVNVLPTTTQFRFGAAIILSRMNNYELSLPPSCYVLTVLGVNITVIIQVKA